MDQSVASGMVPNNDQFDVMKNALLKINREDLERALEPVTAFDCLGMLQQIYNLVVSWEHYCLSIAFSC